MLTRLKPIQPSLQPDVAQVRLPLVIDEQLIHVFKYWHNGLQTGMRYGSDLYARQQSFRPDQRLQAYTLGCEYTEHYPTSVCITVSKQEYVVWVSLKSLSTDVPQQPCDRHQPPNFL